MGEFWRAAMSGAGAADGLAGAGGERPGGALELDAQLRSAAARLDWRAFEGLVEQGASVGARGGEPAPLALAALSMKEGQGPEAIEELARLGAKLDEPEGPYGATLAMLVSASGPLAALAALAKAGADLDARDAGGETALHKVASGGWMEEAELARRARALMELGASVEAPDALGATALHRACAAGRLACAQALLAAGANPNASNKQGSTPLMLLAIKIPRQAARIASELLGAGADPDQADHAGFTPTDLAEVKALAGSDGGLASAIRAWRERDELERVVRGAGKGKAAGL